MSVVRNVLLPHTYRDSVVLMEYSHQMQAQPGVEEAVVMMGTPANLAVLRERNLLIMDEGSIAADDLVLAVRAVDEQAAGEAIGWAKDRLAGSLARPGSASTEASAVTLDHYMGWRHLAPGAGLAVISTPGPFAAAEAIKALRSGLNVFLFSDHVSIDDEVALKAEAQSRGLLVMGPGCGTALIAGMPLGFANRVRRGPVGLVAASGSGLQEITCLLDRLGSGVSHAIGTGGRDLSRAVNAATSRRAIDLLLQDDATSVLVLLSKPPDPQVADLILAEVQGTGMPVVVCFLGKDVAASENLHPARTLEEAALLAARLAGSHPAESLADPDVQPLKRPGFLRGLFAGGTLAHEAIVVLRELIGPVWSNTPPEPELRWDGDLAAAGHLCLDLGAEEYTAERPHPMIDPGLRAEMLVQAARGPLPSVILMDFVLGYGGHPDPVGALLPAIRQAQHIASERKGELAVVASVIGTDDDPKPRRSQAASLAEAGVIVAPSNASAARTAACLLGVPAEGMR